MNAKYRAVTEFFKCSERGKGFEQVLEQNDMTADELMAAIDEVLVSGNDIEGAAIGLAALYHTYPIPRVR